LPLLLPETLTDTGLLLLQVSGTLVSVRPRVSVAVALRANELPVGRMKEVLDELFAGVIVMDWIGHVVKAIG
jgi:hypothetical protein